MLPLSGILVPPVDPEMFHLLRKDFQVGDWSVTDKIKLQHFSQKGFRGQGWATRCHFSIPAWEPWLLMRSDVSWQLPPVLPQILVQKNIFFPPTQQSQLSLCDSTVCSMCLCPWTYFAHLLILFITFHIRVRSCESCLSRTGSFRRKENFFFLTFWLLPCPPGTRYC